MTNILRSNRGFMVAAGALAVVLAGCSSGKMTDSKMKMADSKTKMSKDVKTSHAHTGHVMTKWKGTPGGVG